VARAEPQLPVVLPPDDELRRRAEASTIVGQLRGLAEWAGRDGRAVTAAGRLRMADARELVDVLGTGDKAEGVRSSADLPRLGLLVEWAKKARLVRVAKGRLYAVARARPVLADPLQLLRDGIVAALRERGDTVLECLMPLLRRAAEVLPAAEQGMARLDVIARECADRLRAVCERPPRAA
jgi:hypothetical protein